MNLRLIPVAIVLLCFVPPAWAAAQEQDIPPAVRTVNLKSADGTPLKGTYYPAGKPGPGVLLLHQVNRDRRSWDGVARQAAAAEFRRRATRAGRSAPVGRMLPPREL